MQKNNRNAPHAPRSHELLYLAEKMELELTEKQEDLLDIITKFNMNAGYKIDTRIEPHLIRIEDYKNAETPFIQEVIDTGIKVA